MPSTTTSRPSQSPYLPLIATAFATIFIAFGLNAILRPQHALTFFAFPSPPTPDPDPASGSNPTASASKTTIDGLMVIYGVRDIFMGLAIYATAYFGSHATLGWILIAGSGVAVVDGVVCRVFASGSSGGSGAEWNHWGYAPVLGLVGGLVLRG